MASSHAHHVTGSAAGVIAAALVVQAGAAGPYYSLSAAALVAATLGGTAPDWLENAWWSRRRRLWITHRTLTHWGLAWLAALVYAYITLGQTVWSPVVFGFAAGGLMHLLADWPNPVGVPWIYRRHSLKLWRSGRCDLIVVTAAWLSAAWVLDRVFFHGLHAHWLLQTLKSLI